MLKFIVKRYSVRACDSLYYRHATFHLCGGITTARRREISSSLFEKVWS